MSHPARILAYALLFSTVVPLRAAEGLAPELQLTRDGTTRVGRVKGGFRIAAYGADLTVTTPQDWEVLLCTEQPLDADVVCRLPDGVQSASISVWDASGSAAVTHSAAEQAAPEAYLRALRRSRDSKIKLKRVRDIVLNDGRRVRVWRFHSSYWGERLYATVPAASAVVSVEVGAISTGSRLRETMRMLLESIRTN